MEEVSGLNFVHHGACRHRPLDLPQTENSMTIRFFFAMFICGATHAGAQSADQSREALRKASCDGTDAAEPTAAKTGQSCPNATSTREIEDCLNKELAKTQKNYSTFASALRGLLQREGNDSAVSEFDKIESESKKYRQLCVEAASNRFKGGSIAPIVALQTQQKLLRFHLQELSVVYANELENH